MSRDHHFATSSPRLDGRRLGWEVSTARCLIVWACVTLTSIGATLLGLDAMTNAFATPRNGPHSFDQILVGLAGAAATAVCPWLWLISSLTVGDALRGRVRPGTGVIRRLTLAACGCAVTLAWIAPAHAGEAESSTEVHQPTSSVSVLSGLPFPERPSSRQDVGRHSEARTAARTAAHGAEPQHSPPRVPAATPTHREQGGLHVVEHGDTLWAIAADTLHPGTRSVAPTSAQTAHAVRVLHERNREVLGDDADLIHPGQRLNTTLGGGQER